MKTTSWEEIKDKVYGEKSSPRRDAAAPLQQQGPLAQSQSQWAVNRHLLALFSQTDG